MIKTLKLDNSTYCPGEVLTHQSSEFTHITITYNVSGERNRVDQNIEEAIEQGDNLVKIPHVNTTLYWQTHLGERGWGVERLESNAEEILREKLKQIFIGDDGLDGAMVSVFCMVGNLRAFAFELC